MEAELGVTVSARLRRRIRLRQRPLHGLPGNVGDGELLLLPAIDLYIDAVAARSGPPSARTGSGPCSSRPPLSGGEGRRAADRRDRRQGRALGAAAPVHHVRTLSMSSSRQRGCRRSRTRWCTAPAPSATRPAGLCVGQTCAYDSSAEDVHLPQHAAISTFLLVLTSPGADGAYERLELQRHGGPTTTLVVRDGRAALGETPARTPSPTSSSGTPDLIWTRRTPDGGTKLEGPSAVHHPAPLHGIGRATAEGYARREGAARVLVDPPRTRRLPPGRRVRR